MIEAGLHQDEARGCWVTSYPYLHPKGLLRGMKEVAMKSMLSTERSLKKDEKWVCVYQDQIEDMVERGAA